MGFFNDIANGIVGAVGAVTSPIADLASGLSGGFVDLLEGPTKAIGHLGTNALPSITLRHEVDVKGRIDVGGNISVSVAMPDLVLAAEALRDGLLGFDVFGGAARQIGNQSQQLNQISSFLRDFAAQVHPEASPRADAYYFEVTVLNKTATLQPSVAQRTALFSTTKAGSCLLTIQINGQTCIGGARFDIPVVTNVPESNVRIRKQVAARGLMVTDTDASPPNSVRITFTPRALGPATAAQVNDEFSQMKVHIRLMQSKNLTKSVVFEYVIEGQADGKERDVAIPFFVSHPIYSPAPIVGKKTAAVRDAVLKYADSLSIPNLPDPGAPGNYKSFLDLVESTLIASAHSRFDAARKFQDLVSSLDDDDLNTFDVRTPFFLSIYASSGRPFVGTLNVGAKGSAKPLELLKEVGLCEHDELALRLPFEAGVKVARDKIRDQVLSSDLVVALTTEVIFSISSGFEWANRLSAEKTVHGNMTGNAGWSDTVLLSDVLA